ncbi:MAG: SNF2-related protein [Eubacteriales bacterium]
MFEHPFFAYYSARKLESLTSASQFLPAFSSSDIKVYPFQVAAAGFALNASHLGGVVLCDESGMGKSHETLLLVAQYYYQGKSRSIILIPNSDLLVQWTQLIEEMYSFPYAVVTSIKDCSILEDDLTILTTYDFVSQHIDLFQGKFWDLMVFEEATALSSVYKEENKQGKQLKTFAKNSFKLLLTGTPIEKNIMDLYGLLYFIDETILPPEHEFLSRYLRKPELYPELSQKISPYCFRTLRQQAGQYAKIPHRRNMTLEFSPSKKEEELYQALSNYCTKENKIAFPTMDSYDLSLKLLGTLASSTGAICHTLTGILRRMDEIPYSEEKNQEVVELEGMLSLAQSIEVDEKTKLLMTALEQGFQALKKVRAREKAVIFTESVQTQKYLHKILSPTYRIALYNGSADYTAIQQFKNDCQILISSDHGARGFNLEEVSFLIQYDLLYNTLKMEQRIDRCHRLGQQFDVIALSFVNVSNLSDVRKIELVNKRIAVSQGVLGVSDNVVGGFTDKLDFKSLKLPTKEQLQLDFEGRLLKNEADNKVILSQAEDILFTTFTPELASKLKITPSYIEQEAEDLNEKLWDLTQWFFHCYNQKNTDCFFEIDQEKRTITATKYETLPVLFYYYNGSQNRKYISQKQYGMAKDFKPRHGRISFTSILGQGVLREIEVADRGEIFMESHLSSLLPCSIALYNISVQKPKEHLANYPLLLGCTENQQIFDDLACQKLLSLPITGYEMDSGSPFWLKSSRSHHSLDREIDVTPFLEKHHSTTEEESLLRLEYAKKKAQLTHELEDFRIEVKRLDNDLKSKNTNRMAKLTRLRELNQKKAELRKLEETLFFREMELDVELEEKIKEQTGDLTAKVIRQFVVEVK